MNEVETWKEIPSTEGCYEASSLGRIRRSSARLGGTRIGTILRFSVRRNGYTGNVLSIDRKRVSRSTHRLIAEAFLGPCPKGLQVNHKDGNKANNRASNLEYVTRSQNIRHSIDALGLRIGEKHGRSKLIESEVLDIRRAYIAGEGTLKQLAERFGVHFSTINFIVNRRTWTHI